MYEAPYRDMGDFFNFFTLSSAHQKLSRASYHAPQKALSGAHENVSGAH